MMSAAGHMNPTIGCDPANPWLALPAIVEDVVDETPGVATYAIRIQDDEAARQFRFDPGQFNMLYLPGIGEIAISISGDPLALSCLPHTIRGGRDRNASISKSGPRSRPGASRPIRNELANRRMRGEGRDSGCRGNWVGTIAAGDLRAAGQQKSIRRRSHYSMERAHRKICCTPRYLRIGSDKASTCKRPSTARRKRGQVTCVHTPVQAAFTSFMTGKGKLGPAMSGS